MSGAPSETAVAGLHTSSSTSSTSTSSAAPPADERTIRLAIAANLRECVEMLRGHGYDSPAGELEGLIEAIDHASAAS